MFNELFIKTVKPTNQKKNMNRNESPQIARLFCKSVAKKKINWNENQHTIAEKLQLISNPRRVIIEDNVATVINVNNFFTSINYWN